MALSDMGFDHKTWVGSCFPPRSRGTMNLTIAANTDENSSRSPRQFMLGGCCYQLPLGIFIRFTQQSIQTLWKRGGKKSPIVLRTTVGLCYPYVTTVESKILTLSTIGAPRKTFLKPSSSILLCLLNYGTVAM